MYLFPKEPWHSPIPPTGASLRSLRPPGADVSVTDPLLRSCSRLYAGAARSQSAPGLVDPSEYTRPRVPAVLCASMGSSRSSRRGRKRKNGSVPAVGTMGIVTTA